MSQIQTIFIQYPNNQNFIGFTKDYNELLQSIKEDLEDLEDDETFEIFNEQKKRISNQEQYNDEIKNSTQQMKISVKIIKKNDKKIKNEEENDENSENSKKEIKENKIEKINNMKENSYNEKMNNMKENNYNEDINNMEKNKEKSNNENMDENKKNSDKEKSKNKENKKKKKQKKEENQKTIEQIKETNEKLNSHNNIGSFNEILTKLTETINNKISKLSKTIDNNNKETDLKFKNLSNEIDKNNNEYNNKIDMLEKTIKNLNIDLKKKRISEKKQLSESNINNELQSSLYNFKNQFSNNMINGLKYQINNLSNNINNSISQIMTLNSKEIDNEFEQFAKKTLNISSSVSSHFNLIQAKINELIHYKKHTKNIDFNVKNDNNENKNLNNNDNDYDDEKSFYPTNYDVEIILPKNIKYSKNDLMNNKVNPFIKINNKGMKAIPIKSKIMPIKKGNIIFENIIINEAITKIKPFNSKLKLKSINNMNITKGQQNISVGLFEPNNMLIKEYNFTFSIS